MRPAGPLAVSAREQRTKHVSDVGAVGAVAVSDAATYTPMTSSTTVNADNFVTVNLAEMIASRMNGTAGTSLGAGSAGQTPGIIRAATSASTAGSGGSLDVPDVLRQYGNGKIPKDMLSPIGIGQHRMYSVAADAFKSMRSAAAAEGVDIGVTDSYRTYDQQVELAARKGLWKDGGYAAVPGTSPHGWGMALDLDVSPAGLAWVRANAARFGFEETTPREPWHWEYRGAT